MPSKRKGWGPVTRKDETGLSRNLQTTVWISLGLVLVISLLDLIGWITGIRILKSIGQNWETMKVITALCFVLTSFALAVSFTKKPVRLISLLPYSTGIFLMLVSILTIYSWSFLKITGNESQIVNWPVFSLFLPEQNRMALMTSVIFTLTGVILMLLVSSWRNARNIAHILCFPAGIGSYLIPVSYILNVYSIHQFINTPVALNTGIAFCALFFAIFIMLPDSWLMRVFLSQNIGGMMARRLIPSIIVLPVIIGWVRIYGEHSGIFISEIGVILVALTYTVCLVLLVWFTARSVNIIDQKRHLADLSVKRSHDEMETKVMERTAELRILNARLDEEINVRKNAEALVAAERQRFNGLLELMPAYMILLTPDYHVAYSNRFFRERFGVSNGRRCYEFLFNRSEPCEICDTYRTLRENKPLTWEWTGPDEHKYSIYDFPYTDTDGSPLIMEMGIDVTDLKNAEAELIRLNSELEQRVDERTSRLMESEKRIRLLVDSLPNTSILLFDKDHRFMVAGGGEIERSGFEKSKLEGSTLEEAYPPEVVKLFAPLYDDALAGKQTTFEHAFGTYYYLQQILPVFDKEGKINSGMVISTNITERKKSEQLRQTIVGRLNTVVSSIFGSILLVGDEKIELANQNFCDYFDLDDTPEELVGMSINEMASKIKYAYLDSGQQMKRMKEIISTGKKVLNEEVPMRNGKTCIRDFIPLVTEGKTHGSLWYHLDITEIKNAGSELEKTNQRLQIISDTSAKLLAGGNQQELVRDLCNRVMEFLGCHVFFNFLADESAGKLHLNSYAGISAAKAKKMEWLEYGVAVCGWVAMEGVRMVAENIFETNDPRTELVKSYGVKAYACHPLISKDKVIGTLSFGTNSRTSFSENDLSLMKIVADQVAISMSRIRNEDSIRRSEERYRSLMELSPGASFVSRDGHIVMLNTAARKLLGVNSVDEIIGKSPLEIFHPDYHQVVIERIAKLLKGENVPMAEEQIVRADGAIRDVEVVAAKITDPEGLAVQMIMSDITERKRADKELSDTKNYLQNLIDYANTPIIVWDHENKINLFNHAFEHLTGYKSSEVEGKKLNLLFPKSSLKESLEKIRRAITENWETIEIPILTKNNDVRTVLWNSSRIHDKGRKTYSTIAQGNDITERIKAEIAFKESKEKLELALENGKIGIWEWDINTGFMKWDERMEKMFGLSPGSFENTLTAFERRVHEEDLTHVRHAFRQALENDIPFDTIYRIKHMGEGVNYISSKALVEKNGDGIPVKMTGVCFDITEMKKGTERVLFRLNEELLRSNKELEQFAYIASHDLQEPLRMVSSFTQLLAQKYKDKLDQDAQDFIKFAVDGAVRMQVMINDLLDYSRIETRGREFSPVDMHDVLERVLSNLQIIINEKSAVITNDEIPIIIADEGQMVQLLQNIIGNALKFCKRTPKIHVSVKEENDNFLFSVKDNGIGIEPQYYNRIFQIFQRLHAKDEYGGTGIGLAICRRIIERHDGKIWVESKPGKGSVFNFTIIKRQIPSKHENFSYESN